MKDKMPYAVPLAIGLVLLAILLVLLPGGLLFDLGWKRDRAASGESSRDPWGKGAGEEEPKEEAAPPRDPSDAMFAALLAQLASKHAADDEAILTFKDEAALRDFLARAKAAGLNVKGTIGNSALVDWEDIDALRRDMRDHYADYLKPEPNWEVYMPDVPAEQRNRQSEVGFGESALAFMGIKGSFGNYGKGVKIAILDSGVSAHSAFNGTRLQHIDVGQGKTGTHDSDGHATAVAALAAGSAAGATGTAPSADILSIRVTGPDGSSDMFTLAKGIRAAVDAGAQVINISLGAYQSSGILTSALDYAYAAGSAVVAAAGNDQAGVLTWPAADTRVTSVGGVDALGQQLAFSNSGDQLHLTAPGLELQTAWTDNQYVSFDGTSGAAPLVSGAIAAVMSQTGLSAQQAAQLLTTYSADPGLPGRDPAFGYGTVDLGYALNHANPNYYDPSISSQHFDNITGTVSYVVQNRSGSPLSGAQLNVNSAGYMENFMVPNLDPGQSWSHTVAVDPGQLIEAGQLTYTSRLVAPSGMVDQNSGNNRKGSVVFRPEPAE